jgi:hypothetical protein
MNGTRKKELRCGTRGEGYARKPAGPNPILAAWGHRYVAVVVVVVWG